MNKMVFTDHKANTTPEGMVEVYIKGKKLTVTVNEYLKYICSEIDWVNYDDYTDKFLSSLILNRKIESLLEK